MVNIRGIANQVMKSRGGAGGGRRPAGGGGMGGGMGGAAGGRGGKEQMISKGVSRFLSKRR